MKNAVILVLIFIFSSCAVGKVHHVKTDIIPNDLESEKITLLVESFGASFGDRQLEKVLKDNYPFNYKIVKKETILSSTGEYANTDLYRYAVMMSESDLVWSTGKTSVSYDYYIYDRKEKKDYPITAKPAGFIQLPFKTLINTIIEARKEKGLITPLKS